MAQVKGIFENRAKERTALCCNAEIQHKSVQEGLEAIVLRAELRHSPETRGGRHVNLDDRVQTCWGHRGPGPTEETRGCSAMLS